MTSPLPARDSQLDEFVDAQLLYRPIIPMPVRAVYIHICIYIYICVCVCVCVWKSVCGRVSVEECVCVCVCVCERIICEALFNTMLPTLLLLQYECKPETFGPYSLSPSLPLSMLRVPKSCEQRQAQQHCEAKEDHCIQTHPKRVHLSLCWQLLVGRVYCICMGMIGVSMYSAVGRGH